MFIKLNRKFNLLFLCQVNEEGVGVCVTKFSGSRKVEYDPIKFQHKLTRNNKKAGKLKEGRIQLRFEFTKPIDLKYKAVHELSPALKKLV